jgi:hypothetical protein
MKVTEIDVSWLARPNSAGRNLCGGILNYIPCLLESKYRWEREVAVTRFIVACNIYRKQEDKLPADLQALVPAYLAAIPTDPYDGKPLRYSAIKGIVHWGDEELDDSAGSTNAPAH